MTTESTRPPGYAIKVKFVTMGIAVEHRLDPFISLEGAQNEVYHVEKFGFWRYSETYDYHLRVLPEQIVQVIIEGPRFDKKMVEADAARIAQEEQAQRAFENEHSARGRSVGRA